MNKFKIVGGYFWYRSLWCGVVAVSDSGNINKYDTTNSFIEFSTLPESALDIRATGNYLIVTTAPVFMSMVNN
jgi:hypothetical protein